MAAGAQRESPLCGVIPFIQAIKSVLDRYYLPRELIGCSEALDNTYSMDESNRSEFLLIAGCTWAYMVQTHA